MIELYSRELTCLNTQILKPTDVSYHLLHHYISRWLDGRSIINKNSVKEKKLLYSWQLALSRELSFHIQLLGRLGS